MSAEFRSDLIETKVTCLTCIPRGLPQGIQVKDSINTEKNSGYHYKHAFSYHWNAMKGFHYLMRLAHAINAISEFTKKLKRIIKEQGCSATLKLIKDTLFSPWLPTEWYAAQRLKHSQLRLQLE